MELQNQSTGGINEKIEYWIDVWNELIAHFTKTHYGLELANPHVALMILIDEIEHNELRSKETRQYLLETIGGFYKNDPVVRRHLSAEFSLLLQGFSNQPHFYLLQSAKAVLSFFREGKYFHETYSLLRKIISDANWKPDDESQIETLASSLIVELLLRGYNLKTIQEMPRRLFCDTSEKSNRFPTDVNWNDYVDLTDEQKKEFEVKRADEINDMNLEKRLSAFLKFFSRKAHEHIFIYEVEGLKGETEIQIGPVTFYSPLVRQFIKEDADAKINEIHKETECFRRDKKESFANAAIRVSCIDSENGQLQAVEIADKALDLVRSRYNIECRLKVVRDEYIHLSKAGNFRGGGSSASDSPVIKLHHSLDLKIIADDKENLNDFLETAHYLFFDKSSQSPLEQKISDCLHWLRKGQEADRLEDRLLHYWIVMEKIFTFPSSSTPLIKGNDKLETKLVLISELLSATTAFGFIYQVGRTLYYYLVSIYGNSLRAIMNRNKKQLPKEIAEKCGLSPGFIGQISLSQIRENLDELAQAVNERLVKNRIFSVKRFYGDGNFAKDEIRRIIARTKDDVFLIYRYRNSIVHNAHYDPNLLLPFVEKAATLAQTALNILTYERAKNPSATVEEIFVSKHFEVQRILERLDKNLPVDSLEVQTWNVSASQKT
jgi:hypothetical protein